MRWSVLLVSVGALAGCGVRGADDPGEDVASALSARQAGVGCGRACTAEVTVGNGFTCARRTDGTAWCWGFGGTGQLGDGRQGPNLISTSPGQVTTLGAEVAQIAAGYRHACAVKVDGSLWCWGSGATGQLGNGLQGAGVSSPLPIQVTALGAKVAQVAAGDGHTCAVKVDGSLWCWGYNLDGEVGAGFFSDNPSQPVGVPTPTAVIGLPAPVTEVAAGGFHSCARLTDGRIFCWGVNSLGQLGDGTFNNKNATPQPLGTLGPAVRDVAAGHDQTCAAKTDGSLFCWGGNIAGDLGIGTDFGFEATPTLVTTLDRVAAVAAGQAHSCAITTNGKLFCWGNLQSSRIYTLSGFEIESNVPKRIRGLPPASQVAIGFANTCVITADRALRCAGANVFGALGLGDTVDRLELTEVPLLCPGDRGGGKGHGSRR